MKWNEYFKYERQTISRTTWNFLINCLPDLWIIDRIVRPALARLSGMQCGSGVILQKNIFYGNPRNLRIGNKSVVCRGAFLDGYDKISLGDNVVIAFGVTFITSNHEMGSAERRTGRLFGSPIVVGDGVWIAARATIGPGVEIGAGSMVSSGTVVMKSVPANSLVSGVPGTVVMEMAGGTAAASQLPAVATAPAEISEREGLSPAADPNETETRGDGTITKTEFYAKLEFLLELEPGSILGTESLADELEGWDSMAALQFIAMADRDLQTLLDADALAACQTVSDLVNLFPGRIT